jgi:hypothetical protein
MKRTHGWALGTIGMESKAARLLRERPEVSVLQPFFFLIETNITLDIQFYRPCLWMGSFTSTFRIGPILQNFSMTLLIVSLTIWIHFLDIIQSLSWIMPASISQSIFTRWLKGGKYIKSSSVPYTNWMIAACALSILHPIPPILIQLKKASSRWRHGYGKIESMCEVNYQVRLHVIHTRCCGRRFLFRWLWKRHWVGSDTVVMCRIYSITARYNVKGE